MAKRASATFAGFGVPAVSAASAESSMSHADLFCRCPPSALVRMLRVCTTACHILRDTAARIPAANPLPWDEAAVKPHIWTESVC